MLRLGFSLHDYSVCLKWLVMAPHGRGVRYHCGVLWSWNDVERLCMCEVSVVRLLIVDLCDERINC